MNLKFTRRHWCLTLNSFNFAILDSKTNQRIYIVDGRFYDSSPIISDDVLKSKAVVYRFRKLIEDEINIKMKHEHWVL